MKERSVEDVLSLIKADLSCLAAALNQDGAYEDAAKVQVALIAVDDIEVESSELWRWPPSFEDDGSRWLVDDQAAPSFGAPGCICRTVLAQPQDSTRADQA